MGFGKGDKGRETGDKGRAHSAWDEEQGTKEGWRTIHNQPVVVINNKYLKISIFNRRMTIVILVFLA